MVFVLSTITEGAPERVLVIDASRTEKEILGRKLTVIRGTLRSNSFHVPFTPPYQRIEMTGKKQKEIMESLKIGGAGVPDPILLGLRTTDVRSLGAGEFTLTGPLAIIDGLQRISAGRALLASGEKSQPLDVVVYIDTTEAEEAKLFDQINRKQTRVASHVILRNLGTNPALMALRSLADNDDSFVLKGRVQWDQLKQPGEVITGHMLFEVASALHGAAEKDDAEKLIEALQEIADDIGTEALIHNTRLFFSIVDQCFPFDKPNFQLRLGFLRGFAVMLAEHQNFWDKRSPDRLFVSAEDIAKIAGIDPEDVRKELKTKRAPYNVYRALSHHYDIGRKKNKLQPRKFTA